jgi:hypothetical protein
VTIKLILLELNVLDCVGSVKLGIVAAPPGLERLRIQPVGRSRSIWILSNSGPYPVEA